MDIMTLGRQFARHASTILIGGIFLFFSGVLYLSFCQMNCSEHQFRVKHNKGVLLAKKRNLPDTGSSWLKGSKTLSTFLAVVIMTGPDNAPSRDVIRQTWASSVSRLSEDVKIFFVIGSGNLDINSRQKLELENHQHHDLLILAALNDSYNQLTTKLLKTLVWLEHHVDLQFVMKADDDSFIRLDVLLEKLKGMEPKALYWGFFNGPGRVKKHGPWAENSWILCDNYLPYALGGGYVLSADLVTYVASNANMFVKFKSEDVSLGTWLAAVNVNRVHDVRFDTEYISRGCNNAYIVTHKQSAQDMHEKHANLLQTGKLCTKEFRVRNSYQYNWKLPRSKCCERNDPSIP